MVYIKLRARTQRNWHYESGNKGKPDMCSRKGTSATSFTNVQALFRFILIKIRSKSYLVQKGIHTLLYNGHQFDFRIMTQKNERRKWEVSGIVGRVTQAGDRLSQTEARAVSVCRQKGCFGHI